jgi:hypothetical protein
METKKHISLFVVSPGIENNKQFFGDLLTSSPSLELGSLGSPPPLDWFQHQPWIKPWLGGKKHGKTISTAAYYIILYHTMSYYVILYHTISYHIILYHTISLLGGEISVATPG